MAPDRLRDGVRIAQLLASEVEGDRDALARLAVVDADSNVEADVDGAFAYAVAVEGEGGRTDEERPTNEAGPEDEDGPKDDVGNRIAEVYVQPDRARVEFRVAPDVAAEAGRDTGLRVRPKAVRPPRTLVFVEDGAQVKWVLPVFTEVLDAITVEENEEDGDVRDGNEGGDDAA